jgi:hypothetical protein
MKTIFLGITLLLIAFISSAHAWKNDRDADLVRAASLSRTALSENAADARAAIAELREIGPDGLGTMIATYADQIKAFKDTGEKTADWLKASAALDNVAMQRDSYAAGLYWYTDLEKAKAEAKRTGKPILSLRMLGNLNEELSCANSRFFRTALYPNKDINQILREDFILHWQSVRPAPRVTIDFGDGRKMETTLTGNSIHYVLDSDGKVVDAFPGLYGPQVFLQLLQNARALFQSVKSMKSYNATAAQINQAKVRYYSERLQTINENWATDLQRAKLTLKRDLEELPTGTAYVSAITASRRGMSKVAVESKVIPVTVIESSLSSLEKETDLDKWKKLAAMRQSESLLDENSRAFIQRKLAIKGKDLDKLVKQFEQNLSLDTVRNEYQFHSKLFTWLQRGEGDDLKKFNERVYTELFLTPSSDPWLGLYAPEIYNGLDNGGITN